MNHPISDPLHHTRCPECGAAGCIDPEHGEGRGQFVECCSCGCVAEARHFFDEWELKPKLPKESPMEKRYEALIERLERDGYRIDYGDIEHGDVPSLVCVFAGEHDRYDEDETLLALVNRATERAVVEEAGSEALAELFDHAGLDVAIERECVICDVRYEGKLEDVSGICRGCLELQLALERRRQGKRPLPPGETETS